MSIQTSEAKSQGILIGLAFEQIIRAFEQKGELIKQKILNESDCQILLSSEYESRIEQIYMFHHQRYLRYWKTITACKLDQLKDLHIQNCDINNIESIAWLNTPHLEILEFKEPHIKNLSCVKKWRFPNLKKLSIKIVQQSSVDWCSFSRAQFEMIQILEMRTIKMCAGRFRVGTMRNMELFTADIRSLFKMNDLKNLNLYTDTDMNQFGIEIIMVMERRFKSRAYLKYLGNGNNQVNTFMNIIP